MIPQFEEALDRLTRVPGVQGALIVDAEGGIPVAQEVTSGVTGTATAALVASLFGRALRAGQQAGFGNVRNVHLEAEDGDVFVAGAGELLVVVVASRDAQIGLVRMEAQRVAESLR